MKALILLIVSGVLAAGVLITGKQAGSYALSPLMILFWQMSGGALVVWVVSWPSRRLPVWDVAHLRYYLVGGLLGISLPYVLAFMVLRELPVGTVGLLTALSPVVTYALARVLRLERGHPLRLFGFFLGLAGVSLLVAPQGRFDLSQDGLYLLLALGIPVTLAASNIYRSRYWPAGSESLPLVTGMLTVQGLWLLGANLLLGNFTVHVPAPQGSTTMLGVLALLSGASYLSSFKLLRVSGPVYLSQMGYVITAVTLLAGIVLWGERYDSTQLWSMGLILAGVLLTTMTQWLWQAGVPAPAMTGRGNECNGN